MTGHVVVGVDGSPSSLEAVGVAAREADMRGTALRLVHAFGWPAGHIPPGMHPWSAETAGVRELIDGTMAEAEERAHAAAPGTQLQREVTVGEPLTVLEIESRTAALAVVGSRGRGAFKSLLLGSTAVHLAAHAGCPVMVIRGRADPQGPVVLAVDGASAADAAAELAFAEARMRGAELVAVHVWNTWSEQPYTGPGDPLTAVVVNVEELQELEQGLLDRAIEPWQARYPDVTVERRLVRSRTRTALLETSGEAQLVVVGARGRGGFTGMLLGSVSQALLHHADCPVLVVRGRE
ncbi:universal stress protein [Streptomyces sp. NPDC051940]|uniref:universal stress protein n=1 Tax=Streptomyces sp. NPDC051940 TaxID=3155675 RepID=UPI003432948C